MIKAAFVLTFLALFLSISGNSYSQESDLYLLELKGGLTVKCYLVSLTPDTLYAISEEGKKLTIKVSDIKSFTKLDGEKRKEITQKEKPDYPDLEKDFVHTSLKYDQLTTTLKIGPVLYSNDRTPIYFEFSGILNYELGHFSAGAGFALDLHDQPYLPVFADVKYNFIQDLLGVGFVFLDAGYSLASSPGNGFTLTAGAGLKRKLKNSINLIFDVGFRTQKYNGDYYNLNHDGHKTNLNKLILSAGIQF